VGLSNKPSNLITIQTFISQKKDYDPNLIFPKPLCYNLNMPTQCPNKTKCYYCEEDAIFNSTNEEGFIVDTCRKHFKYMYSG
jgi:hypothetical protein